MNQHDRTCASLNRDSETGKKFNYEIIFANRGIEKLLFQHDINKMIYEPFLLLEDKRISLKEILQMQAVNFRGKMF